MSPQKAQVPAIEGWFTTDGGAPHLLGTRCTGCGSYFFPKESMYCRNPGCAGTEFEEVPLSRTGTIWSFSEHYYQPPEPYVSPDPFVPYTVAAVELTRERMVVMGQLAPGCDPSELEVGMEMKLVLDTLYEDDENEYVVWKWQPVPA